MSGCIDYGGSLRLRTTLNGKLNIGEETELNTRTTIALAEAIEWVSQGRINRCPDKKRIVAMEKGLRMGKLVDGEKAH